MSIEISTLLLLAVLIVAMAVLIGFLLAAVLWGKSPELPPQARKAGFDRYIVLYTDAQFRDLLIQINGKVIDSPASLTDEESRQLLQLGQVLHQWLNSGQAPSSKAEEAAEQAQPLGAASSSRVESAQPVPLQARPAPSEPPETANSLTEKSPPKRGVADWLAQAFQPKPSPSEPAKSIAMQVDEILQRKLQEKGWQRRGIRIMELPHKGMVVLVGLEQYATVEEVPDPEVRALIRASVAEWEAKAYRG